MKMKKFPMLFFVTIFIFLSCGHSASDSGFVPRTFTTSFPLAENPISDSGKWINGGTVGLDWHNVVTTPGLATGTDAPVPWSDATAILTGTWRPDQTVEGTVYSVNPTTAFNQQVELRLRTSISAHNITGYEIFFRCIKNELGTMGIVKWNGPLATYTYLFSRIGPQYGVATGDVVKASIFGTVINAYINNVLVAQVTDSTFSTGNPGMGFNYGCDGTYGDFGFTKFTASELPPRTR
jgi:hypothetical protein